MTSSLEGMFSSSRLACSELTQDPGHIRTWDRPREGVSDNHHGYSSSAVSGSVAGSGSGSNIADFAMGSL